MTDTRRETIIMQNVDVASSSVLTRPPFKHRRSSIMVEIMDNQIAAEDIKRMMEAGINVVRFETSFSAKIDRLKVLGKVDKAAATCSMKNNVGEWPVATCGTLKTCIVKTGFVEPNLKNKHVKEGSRIILTNNITLFDKCNPQRIFIDNPHLCIDTKVGMEVILQECEIELVCTEIIDEKCLECEVTKGGTLDSLMSVCARGMKRSRPYMTSKDVEIIDFCLDYQVDMIIIYYCRHVETVKKVKECMNKTARKPVIFSAMCTQQGLDNLDEILQESDGLVLAREYLPYEVIKDTSYRIGSIQKWVAAKCQEAGKPLYVSGGIMEEVISKGVLTDSQISDVTNALYDGATGFILSKCTDPEKTLDAIHEMNIICRHIEPLLYNKDNFRRISDGMLLPFNAAEAAVLACAAVAIQTEARLIILPTVSGRTLKALLRLRPFSMVVTVSTDIRVTKLLAIYRCTVPLLFTGRPRSDMLQAVQDRITFALTYAVSKHWIEFGDLYVTLHRGTDTSSYCDTVSIWKTDIKATPPVKCDEYGQTILDEKQKIMATTSFLSYFNT